MLTMKKYGIRERGKCRPEDPLQGTAIRASKKIARRQKSLNHMGALRLYKERSEKSAGGQYL